MLHGMIYSCVIINALIMFQGEQTLHACMHLPGYKEYPCITLHAWLYNVFVVAEVQQKPTSSLDDPLFVAFVTLYGAASRLATIV